MTQKKSATKKRIPLEINGMKWLPVRGCEYIHDYNKCAATVANGVCTEQAMMRHLVQNDLWFIVFFVLKIPIANHPHWVNSCKEVQQGQDTNTVDIWAREHAKSTILTIAETIQDISKDPNERICILSYSRSAALTFLRQIKFLLETSEFLKAVFPDVFYQNPQKEAFRWSEEGGLFVKRSSSAKEATVDAYGLIEGMPTGRHYSKLIYDDVVTQDVKDSPEMMRKIKENFDASLNLGTIDGRKRVIGTFYHHDDPLVYIINKKDSEGNPIYHTRTKPATTTGEWPGESVYLPMKKLVELSTSDPYVFACQQLCDPTPVGERRLDPNYLKRVSPLDIPNRLHKFMLVDPAGFETSKKTRGDSWALIVIGVLPYLTDIGASDIYILDMKIEPMNEVQAMDNIIEMYCKHGRILKLAVEKVGLSSMEIHIANALRRKQKYVSVEMGNLHLLRPAGRGKAKRIEANLAWPLANGKVHISEQVPSAYFERLKMEMDKFPYWHDDGLDVLSYSFDLLKDYKFSSITAEELDDIEEYWADKYDFREPDVMSKTDTWMVC